MDFIDVPQMQDALPAAGTRVKQTAPEYVGTKVHYSPLHGCTGEVGDEKTREWLKAHDK